MFMFVCLYFSIGLSEGLYFLLFVLELFEKDLFL